MDWDDAYYVFWAAVIVLICCCCIKGIGISGDLLSGIFAN